MKKWLMQLIQLGREPLAKKVSTIFENALRAEGMVCKVFQ